MERPASHPASLAAPLPIGGAACEALAVVALVPLLAALAASARAEALGSAGWGWAAGGGWSLMGRTVGLAAGAATIALAAAWVLTGAAVRLPDGAGRVAVVLACLPLLIPSTLLATAWIAALGRQGVLARPLARWLGVRVNVYSPSVAAAAMAMRYFGIAAIVLMRRRLWQRGTVAAERVFGIRPAAILWTRLRGAAPAAAVAWLLVAAFAMGDHVLPDMLEVPTYGTQMLILVQARLDAPAAAALAAPMAAVAMAMLLAAAVLLRRQRPPDQQAAGAILPRPGLRQVLPAGAIAVAVLGAALAGPVIGLLWRAGSARALLEAWDGAKEEVSRTAVLAATAGCTATAIGAVLAGRWLRRVRARRISAVPVVLLNLAAAPMLLAIGTIDLTQRWPLWAIRDTNGPLLIAYVTRLVPVATLVLFAAWRGGDDGPVLAARVHGVGRWRTAWRVVWPARRAGLLAAALLTGLLAATELEASVLLAAPGRGTLGVRLQSMIHTAPAWMFSALAVDVLLLAAPCMVALTILATRSARR